MNNLNGKIAVVTGGNSGIGYATAQEFKDRGATVIITGRRVEAVQNAASALGVIGKVADQSSMGALDQLTAEIKKEFGKVDYLFINAGVIGKLTIEAATESFWHQLVDINLKGAYFTLSRFIPLLNDGGSVVFLSSNVATKTIAGSSVYALTKTAINSIVRTAALELAPRKIRVNAVSPGPTETNIFDKLGLDSETIKDIKTGLQSQIPLAAIGDAADVAKMVVYFCSEEAKFITGTEIIMDGGMVLK